MKPGDPSGSSALDGSIGRNEECASATFRHDHTVGLPVTRESAARPFVFRDPSIGQRKPEVSAAILENPSDLIVAGKRSGVRDE